MPEADQGDWTNGPGFIASLWRYRWLVAGVTIIAGVVGYALSSSQPPSYSSTTRLLLREANSSVFSDDLRPYEDPTLVPEQIAIISSPPVMERASEILMGDVSASTLSQRVSVEAADDLEIIDVTATAGDPEMAAEIADAVAQAHQEITEERAVERAQRVLGALTESQEQTQERIEALDAALAENPDDASTLVRLRVAQRQLNSVGTRAQEVAIDASIEGASAEVFAPATVPDEPSAPQPLLAAIVGAFLGLVCASVLAWWRAAKVVAADSSEDPATVLGVPLLGEVPLMRLPDDGGVPTLSALPTASVEAYHLILSAVEFSLGAPRSSTIVLTSADPGDGKTLTALNLSLAAARDGRRVMLVDADERVRGLTGRVGAANERGLTDLSDNAIEVEAASTIVGDVSAGQPVRFVPAGRRSVDAAGFFRTPAFHGALARIALDADLVVVDTPPVLAVADSLAVASRADGIVLVVNKGTRLRRLEEVRERLEFVGTPVLGYVFNRSRGRQRNAYAYGYGPPSHVDTTARGEIAARPRDESRVPAGRHEG